MRFLSVFLTVLDARKLIRLIAFAQTKRITSAASRMSAVTSRRVGVIFRAYSAPSACATALIAAILTSSPAH